MEKSVELWQHQKIVIYFNNSWLIYTKNCGISNLYFCKRTKLMKKLLASLAITALAAMPLAAQESSGASGSGGASGSAGGASGGAAGGAGAGARIQVQDISGAGVTEVIVNAAGQNYEEGDELTFSSGTAEAEVSIVNGGFAPESGSTDIHVELETGTISGTGSGDLLLEDAVDNERGGKFIDSASPIVDLRIRVALENESGGLLSEESVGSISSSTTVTILSDL